MSVAEEPENATDLSRVTPEAMVAELKQRGAFAALMLNNIDDIETRDLIAEMKDRIAEPKVQDFIVGNAPDDDDDDDDWGDGASLDVHDTRDILAELRDRASGGDVFAEGFTAAFEASIFNGEPVGLGWQPSDHPPALADGVLTIAAASLHWALSAVCPVIERRNTISIVGTVRLYAGAGLVEFTGTDLDIEVSAGLALVACEGPSLQLCFAPHALLRLVRQLDPDALVRISLHGQAALIVWEDGAATLPTLPASDFPPYPLDHYHIEAKVTEGLIEALDSVAACISTEETRYYLNGVCFNKDTGPVTVTATDGHRLAALPVALPEEMASLRPILPRKSVELVRRLFRNHAFTVRVHGQEPKHMCFIAEGYTAEGLTLRSKLIDGAFPEWNKVADKARQESTEQLVVDRAAFLRAVEGVVPFSAERARSVLIEVENGRLVARVDNPDCGRVSIDAGPAEGDLCNQGPIGINGDYLLSALRRVRGERVTLRGLGPSSPIRLEDDAAAPGACSILMPLRV